MQPNSLGEAERIAGELTKAQRSYLTDKAQWARPKAWAQERWMTFPPRNTHMVLQRLGLVDGVGQIRDIGLAVRTILQQRGDTP